MTVGHELEKITQLKLFHNHMTIEPLFAIFGDAEETWRLSGVFRRQIFEAAAKSNVDGLIFTYVWAFDLQSDWDWVENVCKIFEAEGSEIYFVELEADLQERLERNKTPHRLEHKPTKRNIEWSEAHLKETLEQYRLNSYDGEITRKNYLTQLSQAKTGRYALI
ncbi:shikimate kinase [Alicyclobacillus fastidiosus]